MVSPRFRVFICTLIGTSANDMHAIKGGSYRTVTGDVVELQEDEVLARMNAQKTELHRTGRVSNLEWFYVKNNGALVPVEESVVIINDDSDRPYAAVCMARDITDRRRAEHERKVFAVRMQQADKMGAIGQLAAGIAHEINTPTQYVGDNLRFLQEAFTDLARLLRELAALRAVLRAEAPETAGLKALEATVAEMTLCILK